MTLIEKILIAGGKAGREAIHAGFGAPGEFLAKPMAEKFKILTESPSKKLPRMLDAGDKTFWEEV